MALRSFAKYEGLGNDFILMGAVDEVELSPESARALCDRHRGIGADGVLLILPPRAPGCVGRMKVINADGSVPEMCGNGLRCVALHLARARGLTRVEYLIETDAGPRKCEILDTSGDGLVSVDMGIVRLNGARTLVVDEREIEFQLADAGNPHAVVFGSFTRQQIDSIGAQVSAHSSFSRGTNVEFATMAADSMELVVWERGVGVTLACGTGACAAVRVACEKNFVTYDTPFDVRLLGGVLSISVERATGRAFMRGPARHVYSGQLAS